MTWEKLAAEGRAKLAAAAAKAKAKEASTWLATVPWAVAP